MEYEILHTAEFKINITNLEANFLDMAISSLHGDKFKRGSKSRYCYTYQGVIEIHIYEGGTRLLWNKSVIPGGKNDCTIICTQVHGQKQYTKTQLDEVKNVIIRTLEQYNS